MDAAYAYFTTRAPAPKGSPQGINPLRTPGVQNVEKAYANGGATTTHQPAYGGGSIQGSRGANGLRLRGATGVKNGINSEHIGEEQRPTQPGLVGQKLGEMNYESKTRK